MIGNCFLNNFLHMSCHPSGKDVFTDDRIFPQHDGVLEGRTLTVGRTWEADIWHTRAATHSIDPPTARGHNFRHLKLKIMKKH